MISLEWVKDYIDISDEDLNELAVKITKAGINIESVITKNIPIKDKLHIPSLFSSKNTAIYIIKTNTIDLLIEGENPTIILHTPMIIVKITSL